MPSRYCSSLALNGSFFATRTVKHTSSEPIIYKSSNGIVEFEIGFSLEHSVILSLPHIYGCASTIMANNLH